MVILQVPEHPFPENRTPKKAYTRLSAKKFGLTDSRDIRCQHVFAFSTGPRTAGPANAAPPRSLWNIPGTCLQQKTYSCCFAVCDLCSRLPSPAGGTSTPVCCLTFSGVVCCDSAYVYQKTTDVCIGLMRVLRAPSLMQPLDFPCFWSVALRFAMRAGVSRQRGGGRRLFVNVAHGAPG